MKCETLDVWKRSCRLSVHVYRHLDRCRDFGFKDQITRSALSIGSNIAEGVEKESAKETLRYLDIAAGSIAEFITQTYIGMEIGFVEKRAGKRWIQELNELSKMLKSLKKNYKGKIQ